MIFLVYFVEAVLVFSVMALCYRVYGAYQATYGHHVNRMVVVDPLPQTISQPHDAAFVGLNGKTIVEDYIGEFFGALSIEEMASHNPLHSIQRQHARETQDCAEQTVQAAHTTKERSISEKVIDAMMAEADLLCVS